MKISPKYPVIRRNQNYSIAQFLKIRTIRRQNVEKIVEIIVLFFPLPTHDSSAATLARSPEKKNA